MKNEVGIGFRRDLADEIITGRFQASFLELAPENWISMGGYWKKKFRQAAERFPITSHGLSLSIGSPDPLDFGFLKQIKTFLETNNITVYSEHLSYSKCDNAHLYDLLPIPFRADAVKHVAERIRIVQDYLERRIAIENVSYYTAVAAEMDELTFICAVLEEADCDLLLDVNNVYVNSFNHGYNAEKFIEGLPMDRVSYLHMAGHEQISETLIIDTHGEAIIDPVFELLEFTSERLKKPVPVLLERDFNFPNAVVLNTELEKIRTIMAKKSDPICL